MDNKELVEMAKVAQINSYSPYSKFKVGAALLCKSGKVFSGCNVETANYTANCAERTAVCSAIANGEQEFEAIAIFGENDKFCFPCGNCRQLLVEFNPDIKVIVSEKDKIETYLARDLLPSFFGPQNLKQ